MKGDIKKLTEGELATLLMELGQPRWRLEELLRWWVK